MLTSYRGGNLTEAAKLFSRRLDVFSPSDVLETTQVELESQSVETFGASGALNAASSDCASLLNRTSRGLQLVERRVDRRGVCPNTFFSNCIEALQCRPVENDAGPSSRTFLALCAFEQGDRSQ